MQQKRNNFMCDHLSRDIKHAPASFEVKKELNAGSQMKISLQFLDLKQKS